MPLKHTYKVIGIMSGTSLDGIDLAYVEFTHDSKWSYTLTPCRTVPYSQWWKEELANLHLKSIDYIRKVEKDYSQLLAQHINDFIQTKGLKPDLIASHGHTVWHQPNKGITLQIGDGQLLKTLTKTPVVCDFRSHDVKLGGQGAPLVPIGDELLFKSYSYCLNLGGFSNISFSRDKQRLAFDICPVNMALNELAKQLGKEYDKNGHMARSGRIIPELLDKLNSLDYYHKSQPKSLGKEWFEAVFLPEIEKHNHAPRDVLRTLCEHIAMQIGKVCQDGQVLVTGGGAHNTFLMQRITFHSNCHFEIPNPWLIDYKEALIFGLLGVLKLRGEVNCLASVTGALRDSVGGKYFP